MDKPANRYPEAWLTGNGSLGTIVYGKPGAEQIVVVHEKLWDLLVDRSAPFEGKGMKQVVEACRVACRKGLGVGRLACGMMAGRVTGATNGQRRVAPKTKYHPGFRLDLTIKTEGPIRDYHRTLDLETGYATVSYKDSIGSISEQVFSSRADNVNAVRLARDGGNEVDVTLGLNTLLPGTLAKRAKVEVSGNCIYMHYSYAKDKSGYEGFVRIESKGGKLQKQENTLCVTGAEEIVILSRINYLMDAKAGRKNETIKDLNKLAKREHKSLLSDHSRLHAGIFNRSTLELGASDQWKRPVSDIISEAVKQGATPVYCEMTYAAGRYFLLSDSGDYPPALLGIWTGDWNSPWNGGFVYDSNVNLQTYMANMANMRECMESYMKHTEKLLPGWRLNAKNFLECRGFLPAHYADPETGHLYAYNVNYCWFFWPGGGGWNIRPFYDYYLTYGDDDFLRKRVLPLYKEQAQFYEDYLVKNKDGKYDIAPGVSPENCPRKSPKGRGGGGMPVTYNTAFDLAVAREVLTILIDACERFGIEKEGVKRWKEMRENLYDYRINDDGALAEWTPKNMFDSYSHRHNSHLYGAFPSLELSMDDVSEELVEAAKKAVDMRCKGKALIGHGLVELGLISARLKHHRAMKEIIETLTRSRYFYPSMASRHTSQMVFDVSGAVPMIYLEMLCYTRPGVVELMPCWPDSMPQKGSIKGLMTRCGAQLDMEWSEGKPVAAILTPIRDGKCQVRYRERKKDIKMRKGRQINLSAFLE